METALTFDDSRAQQAADLHVALLGGRLLPDLDSEPEFALWETAHRPYPYYWLVSVTPGGVELIAEALHLGGSPARRPRTTE